MSTNRCLTEWFSKNQTTCWDLLDCDPSQITVQIFYIQNGLDHILIIYICIYTHIYIAHMYIYTVFILCWDYYGHSGCNRKGKQQCSHCHGAYVQVGIEALVHYYRIIPSWVLTELWHPSQPLLWIVTVNQ